MFYFMLSTNKNYKIQKKKMKIKQQKYQKRSRQKSKFDTFRLIKQKKLVITQYNL